MKRIVKIIIFLFLILCVVIVVYITIAWIPVKYAVREEDFVKHGKLSTSFAGYQKVYLCKVEEVPELKDIKGIMCQVYKIIEWYPIYPVIRDPTVLPGWIYPAEFINIYDMSDDPVW